ncbi:flagellar hook basal-body protein [Ferrovibrio sp.]|uniref:flagellar hook basal-body protein n=1 Tax=Ferrovibrio sp. TaxID=1917215 RepID=UPI002624C5BF|nr:flagellar hook-basal body complex protein [Ferrovibrio sp.]
MNSVMSMAVQAINAQAMAISNISDNVANSSTVGYKAVQTQFLDLVQGMQSTSSPVLGGSKQMGVTAYADFLNRGQGQIVSDSSTSSAAISGNGFFPVAKPTGVDPETGEPTGFESTVYYTRQGDFHLDSSGRLVNAAGYYLMAAPASGTGTPQIYTVDADDNAAGGSFTGVSITDGGAITVSYDDGSTSVQGQILLANFAEPDSLDRVDGTAFLATEESGRAVYGNPVSHSNGVGSIVGSALEQSTADTADQMTKLIIAQQAYSMNSQVIQAANEMMTTALGMKG